MRSPMRRPLKAFSKKEVSCSMISNSSVEIHTTAQECAAVPSWFAEVTLIAQYLSTTHVLDAFAHQVHLKRKHAGTYEPIDFLCVLLGYAISGQPTLTDFWRQIAPFSTP